jgi:hypothetical protein
LAVKYASVIKAKVELVDSRGYKISKFSAKLLIMSGRIECIGTSGYLCFSIIKYIFSV